MGTLYPVLWGHLKKTHKLCLNVKITNEEQENNNKRKKKEKKIVNKYWQSFDMMDGW